MQPVLFEVNFDFINEADAVRTKASLNQVSEWKAQMAGGGVLQVQPLNHTGVTYFLNSRHIVNMIVSKRLTGPVEDQTDV